LQRSNSSHDVTDTIIQPTYEHTIIGWQSHSNRVRSDGLEQYVGPYFGCDHEILLGMKEGDRLIVMMHAQFSGWQNQAAAGLLRVFTNWQPSDAFLTITYGHTPLVDLSELASSIANIIYNNTGAHRKNESRPSIFRKLNLGFHLTLKTLVRGIASRIVGKRSTHTISMI
jgi:hypothetical protein